MKTITTLAKQAAKVGVFASLFFYALGLTAPTRALRAMILSNSSIRG